MNRSMRTRIISGAIAGALLLVILYYRGYFLVIPGMLFAFFGVYEFNQAFEHAGHKPLMGISIALSLLSIYTFVFNTPENFKNSVAVGLISFLCVLAYHVFTEHSIVDVMISAFSLLYVVMPLILIMHLGLRSDNYLYLAFLLAIASDIFAYFVGKAFGKTKLIEKISPKKTVEGAIGGMIGCVISTLIFKIFFASDMSYQAAIVIGVIGSITSQVGDLTASKIKRYCEIKDFGRVIPGHGGVLDRLDSILFTATLVFMYVWVFVS